TDSVGKLVNCSGLVIGGAEDTQAAGVAHGHHQFWRGSASHSGLGDWVLNAEQLVEGGLDHATIVERRRQRCRQATRRATRRRLRSDGHFGPSVVVAY